MSTQHTPGPWHRNIRADGKYPVVFAGRNTHVATVSQQKSGDETESNIDLIAAAPDLLAALKWAGRFIATSAHDPQLMEVVNAAMAKAEGRAE